jgi:hypothetical protein
LILEIPYHERKGGKAVMDQIENKIETPEVQDENPTIQFELDETDEQLFEEFGVAMAGEYNTAVPL